MKCPYCGEQILAVSKKCKHCGEWLTGYKEDDPSRRADVRIAATQAGWNKENAGAFSTQALVIAIVMGCIYQSWWVGAGTFAGLGFLLVIPFIGQLVCIILSVLYAYLAYMLGAWLISESAGWVLALFVGLGTLGMNVSARDWLKDVSKNT